jgi:hypothetical protein
MRQQESVQQQVSQMLRQAPPPMNAMADLARQNLELWNRVQEGMLGLLVPPRANPAAGEDREEPAAGAPGRAEG